MWRFWESYLCNFIPSCNSARFKLFIRTFHVFWGSHLLWGRGQEPSGDISQPLNFVSCSSFPPIDKRVTALIWWPLALTHTWHQPVCAVLCRQGYSETSECKQGGSCKVGSPPHNVPHQQVWHRAVDSEYVDLKGRRVYKGWQPVDRIPERCYVNSYDFESTDLGAHHAGDRCSRCKHIFNCCQVP